MTSFDPIRALWTLVDFNVRFVIVGGVAARIWGSPTVTRDIDVCPDRSADNLDRLAEALRSLDARLRGVEDDVPFLLDGRTLRAGGNFTFSTSTGPLDLVTFPAGVNGYDELVTSAREIDLGGLRVLVAGLPDLMRMKAAAARPKDLVELEILRAIAAATPDSLDP